MCGIVGAASRRNIVPVLVEGLKRLEYRGYDSCGVAVHQGGLRRARSTSRVAELEAQTLAEDITQRRQTELALAKAIPRARAMGVVLYQHTRKRKAVRPAESPGGHEAAGAVLG